MQTTEMARMTEPAKKPAWLRFLPIVLIALGAGAALVFARDFLSFSAIAEHYQTLIAWREDHWLATVAVFFVTYVVCVAFSVPGATWLTLIGGFLFGTLTGSLIVVPAATLGAVAIFLAARTALGDALRSQRHRHLSARRRPLLRAPGRRSNASRPEWGHLPC